jgi:rhodanese-related sulfurtransferase
MKTILRFFQERLHRIKVRRIGAILLAGLAIGICGLLTQKNITFRELFAGPRSAEPFRPLAYRKVELAEAIRIYYSATSEIIDTRAPKYYAYSHIAKAVNVPLIEMSRLDSDLLGRLKKADDVLLYCGNVTCGDSVRLAMLLSEQHGLKNLRVYEGGWQEWQSSHLPISQ